MRCSRLLKSHIHVRLTCFPQWPQLHSMFWGPASTHHLKYLESWCDQHPSHWQVQSTPELTVPFLSLYSSNVLKAQPPANMPLRSRQLQAWGDIDLYKHTHLCQYHGWMGPLATSNLLNSAIQLHHFLPVACIPKSGSTFLECNWWIQWSLMFPGTAAWELSWGQELYHSLLLRGHLLSYPSCFCLTYWQVVTMKMAAWMLWGGCCHREDAAPELPGKEPSRTLALRPTSLAPFHSLAPGSSGRTHKWQMFFSTKDLFNYLKIFATIASSLTTKMGKKTWQRCERKGNFSDSLLGKYYWVLNFHKKNLQTSSQRMLKFIDTMLPFRSK